MGANKLTIAVFTVICLAVSLNGAEVNKDLPPPNNFDAESGHAFGNWLNWEEPDSSSNTLIGYYLYRIDKGKLFLFDELPSMPYIDYMVYPGQIYTYWVTALYEEGESPASGIDSAYCSIVYEFYNIAFEEDWHDLGWYQEPPDGNWIYNSSLPCAELSSTPNTSNYDMSLISQDFDLPDYLKYDKLTVNMYIADAPQDGGEMMEIWLDQNNDETLIFQWDLDMCDDWGTFGGSDFIYEDMEDFNFDPLKIIFTSHGAGTVNFNYWYIYSVKLTVAAAQGNVEGYVYDMSGEPIEEARINANYDSWIAQYNCLTDSAGYYDINPMYRGNYDLKFHAPGYSTVYFQDIFVENDSTLYYEVYLGVPTMEVYPAAIQDTIEYGYIDSTYLIIENNGTGALEWSATSQDYSPPGDTTWLTMSDSAGIVPAGESRDVSIIFDATSDLKDQVLTCDIILNSNPDVGSFQIPVELTVTGYSVEQEQEESNPEISVSPNPFHKSTTFSYSGQTNFHDEVEIKIYNLKGQLIKNLPLVTQSQSHKLSTSWDGSDSDGEQVSPGIYFYQMQFLNNKKYGKVVKLK